MSTSLRPVLSVEEAEFQPPFCPRPRCRFHRDSRGWRWRRAGTHFRKAPPHRVQRFRCLECGRDFSTQTFRTTYWLKRPELQGPILRQLGSCSAYRQIARVLDCVHSTVLNQARRLGRHGLLFERRHAPPRPPDEPVVLDGLKSFEFSKFWPFDLNHLTGAKTHYFYAFNISELRRSGSMTERQVQVRERLEQLHGRPDPLATRRQVERLLRRLSGGPCALRLRSDEHPEYERAVERLDGWRVEHVQVSSKAPRTPRNPLFTANLLDLLMRHGGANHKRKTIAWSKRRQSAMLRTAAFQVDRNWMRGIRARDGRRSPTPAMLRGLARRRLEPADVLAERLFPTRMELGEELIEAYYERIPTRQLGTLRQHDLVYAF